MNWSIAKFIQDVNDEEMEKRAINSGNAQWLALGITKAILFDGFLYPREYSQLTNHFFNFLPFTGNYYCSPI
jgi:hypothetical protein